MQLAAQPDDLEELIRIGELVQNVPREWLDSREDMFHALRRVGGRIKKISARIERIETTKRPTVPTRIPVVRRAKLPAPAGQLEMVL